MEEVRPVFVAILVVAISWICWELAKLLRHVQQRKRDMEAVDAPKAAATTLTPAELARILGNVPPEDEWPPAMAEVPQHLDEGTCAADENDGVTTGHDRGSPADNVEEPGPTGQELLKALEGEDSELACDLVRRAGVTALNYTDDLGRNALLLAASEGHTAACAVLLEREEFAGMNVRNMIGASALHLAAANDQTQMCRDLLACPRFTLGVNAEASNGQTPLDYSIEFGEGAASDMLTAAGGRRATGGSCVQRRQARERVRQAECGGGMQTVLEDSGPDMSALD